MIRFPEAGCRPSYIFTGFRRSSRTFPVGTVKEAFLLQKRRSRKWIGLLLLVAALGALMATLLAVYGVTVMLDSASLTVGALGAAAPQRRGSTLAVHTTLGTTMAFLAPLASGFALDLTGSGATVLSWVACFLVLAAGIALGPVAIWGLGGQDAAQACRRTTA